MFKELTPLLRKGDTLSLTIGREADNAEGAPVFRVNVMPKLFTMDGEKGENRKALNTPVSIMGAAEELDSPGFVDTLNRFTTSVQQLRHTIDEAEAAHKSRSEEKKKAPSPAADKKGKKAAKRGRPAGPAKPPKATTGKRRGRPPGKGKDNVAAALAVPESVTGDAKAAEPEKPAPAPAPKPAKPTTAEAKTEALF